jgi:Tol biopolymer transport system component
MNMNGSDIHRITDNTYWENQADISPDGKKIVCSIHYSPQDGIRETDPGWEIAVMDIDGSNLERLTNNDWLDFGAHWNHDGTEIVYLSDSMHRTVADLENVTETKLVPQYDIYVMKTDGSNNKQLTYAKPGEVYADPSFSFSEPSRILYIGSKGLTSNFNLYMMDADGSNCKLILEHDDMLLAVNDPMFSSDGNRIIFEAKVRESGTDGNPVYNIFTVDANGGDLKRITDDDGEADVLPQYSPDGCKIVYYTWVFQDGGRTHQIRIANPDGSSEQIISSYPWESSPSWIPLSDNR